MSKTFLRIAATHLLACALGVLAMLALASHWNKNLRAVNASYEQRIGQVEKLEQKSRQLEEDLRSAVTRGVKIESALNLCKDQLKKLQMY
jgi:septal ring factor EnvC (AmiA/AmiB activator)